MSRWLKPILSGIWGLLLIPLIATILEKRLEENFFSDPNAAATTVFSNLVALGHQPWFQFVLVFFTGIVIGISLDWLARKSDQNRASELRSLGSKFRILSDSIKSRTASSGWPNNVRDLKPEIMSALISAKKFDLWPIYSASCRRRLRIFDFDPGFRGARPIRRVELLRKNTLQGKITGGSK
jgi:hypothetical protein